MSSNKVVINDSADYTFEVSDAVCDSIIALCKAPVEVADGEQTPTNSAMDAIQLCREMRDYLKNYRFDGVRLDWFFNEAKRIAEQHQ